jgi:hypothetical protein
MRAKRMWVLLLDFGVGVAVSVGIAILGGIFAYPLEWGILVGSLISLIYFNWLSPSFRISKRGRS